MRTARRWNRFERWSDFRLLQNVSRAWGNCCTELSNERIKKFSAIKASAIIGHKTPSSLGIAIEEPMTAHLNSDRMTAVFALGQRESKRAAGQLRFTLLHPSVISVPKSIAVSERMLQIQNTSRRSYIQSPILFYSSSGWTSPRQGASP